ncbi:MAG: hypothetical protein ACRDID_08855, partial [Ktedonobacterales bacterium]
MQKPSKMEKYFVIKGQSTRIGSWKSMGSDASCYEDRASAFLSHSSFPGSVATFGITYSLGGAVLGHWLLKSSGSEVLHD